MAHVGAFYKLQFRRDLHLDVLNNRGWPEAFLVAQAGISGPFGDFIAHQNYLCVNQATTNQPPMVWRSGLYDGGGRDTFMMVTIRDPLTAFGAPTVAILEIFRTFAIQPLVAAEFQLTRGGAGYDSFSGIEPTSEVETDTGYDCDTSWSVGLGAATWDIYP